MYRNDYVVIGAEYGSDIGVGLIRARSAGRAEYLFKHFLRREMLREDKKEAVLINGLDNPTYKNDICVHAVIKVKSGEPERDLVFSQYSWQIDWRNEDFFEINQATADWYKKAHGKTIGRLWYVLPEYADALQLAARFEPFALDVYLKRSPTNKPWETLTDLIVTVERARNADGGNDILGYEPYDNEWLEYEQ